MDFKRKSISYLGYPKGMSDDFEKEVKAYKKRREVLRERMASGCLDSPYLPDAISLGPINMNAAPIYKINVPGYFFRRHKMTESSLAGYTPEKSKTAIFVASDPNYLVNNDDSDKRILYTSCTDLLGNNQGNNMIPILPGTSTYAYIVRDPDLGEGELLDEFFFVPTVYATCLNINPRDYLTIVGLNQENLTISGGDVSSIIGTQLLKDIFSGECLELETAFRPMLGWLVLNDRDDKIKFLSDYGERFRSDRLSWIDSHHASRSLYGY